MNKKIFLIIWSILLAGLVIGTFTDLPLSLRLYDRNNVVAKRIDMFAMAPSMMLVEVCCCTFSWYNREDKARFTAGILLTVLMGFLVVNEINKRLGMNILVVIVLGAVLAAGSYAVMMIKKPEISETQYAAVTNMMLSALLIFVITSGIKTVWGRLRFYAMEDPAAQFTSWYVIKPWGLNDRFRSFPSGHSSFSVMMFYMTAVIGMQNVKTNRSVMALIAVLWTVAVMWGRITYGAHFLTDTCVGSLIGTVCVYKGMHNIYKKY